MTLENTYKKIILFLNKHHFNYLVMGGIAAGIMGEPRMTGDIDLCLFIKKQALNSFFKKIKEERFRFNPQEARERIRETGTFKILSGSFHIDFIIASTEFENCAFKRKQRIKFEGVTAFFPSVEDLIIFKLIPGRPQDIVDVEKLIIRNRATLDIKYLENWAQRLSDEAQDLKIWNELKRLLKKTS